MKYPAVHALFIWLAVFNFLPSSFSAIPEVPESTQYDLIYELDIPVSASFNQSGVFYTTDNSQTYVKGFSRVAYFLELVNSAGVRNWVWVSMDAFTKEVGKVGVPVLPAGAVFAQNVTNMNVFSSVTSVTQGENIATGNLEFWPSNYDQANNRMVPNGTPLFDWGDSGGGLADGYGSMQVHNHGVPQVIFAYNHWGNGGATASDIGIGNQPPGSVPPDAAGSAYPDYTFTQTARSYTSRRLLVFVKPVALDVARVTAARTRTGVYVEFNRTMSESILKKENYKIAEGLTIDYVTAHPQNPKAVFLKTSPQESGKTYNLEFSNIIDSLGDALPAGKKVPFQTSLGTDSIFTRAPESTNAFIMYDWAIPLNGAFTKIPYDKDQSDFLFGEVERVGYHLELTNPAGTQWVYVSMLPFKQEIGSLGIPAGPSGSVIIQEYLPTMNVYSSVEALRGQNITTGNIEFWSGDYDAPNSAAVPNADGTLWDWGDRPNTGGGFGSMQVHNHGSRQVVFAFNHFGNAGTTPFDIGIGTSPSGNPDYTFEATASLYTARRLQVLIQLKDPDAPPPPPVLPVLRIERIETGCRVSWPLEAGIWVLQRNDDLNFPEGWTSLPDFPQVIEDRYAIDVDATPTASYFRLVQEN